MNKKLMMIALTVVAVGCSNDKKSEGGGGGTSLEFKQNFKTEMMSAKPLKAEQKAKVSQWLKAQDANLPATDLIFDKYSDWKKRESDLAKLNADGKAVLEMMKANCTAPQTNSTSQISEVGETAVSIKTESISGDKCPISYIQESRETFTLTQRDVDAGIYSGTQTTTSSDKKEVLDKVLAQKSMAVRMISESKGSSIMENVRRGTDGKMLQGASYSEITVTGAITFAEGIQAKVKMSVEALKKPELDKAQSLLTLHFEDFEIVIAVFETNGKKEAFVNGVPSSEEEIKSDFGITF